MNHVPFLAPGPTRIPVGHPLAERAGAAARIPAGTTTRGHSDPPLTEHACAVGTALHGTRRHSDPPRPREPRPNPAGAGRHSDPPRPRDPRPAGRRHADQPPTGHAPASGTALSTQRRTTAAARIRIRIPSLQKAVKP